MLSFGGLLRTVRGQFVDDLIDVEQSHRNRYTALCCEHPYNSAPPRLFGLPGQISPFAGHLRFEADIKPCVE